MESIFSIGDVSKVNQAIMDAVKEISDFMRYSTANKIMSSNNFGETQLDLDVQTDSLIYEALQKSGVVHTALSEERPYPTELGGDKFIVTFDPLDGSSIVEANFCVGSIFAIWPNKDLFSMSGRDIIGAAIALYGPRTVLLMYNQNTKQIDELTLRTIGTEEKWMVTRPNLTIKEKATIFSPGNLKAIQDHEGYKKLIDYWLGNGYTLRYSGGMAPDCFHMFVKGQGVFSYMGSKKSPPKLRLLYECAPISFMVEAAGGASTDGEKSVLDIKVEKYEQRCAICVGSKEEVQRVEQFYKEFSS